jgi:hypothetical protein
MHCEVYCAWMIREDGCVHAKQKSAALSFQAWPLLPRPNICCAVLVTAQAIVDKVDPEQGSMSLLLRVKTFNSQVRSSGLTIHSYVLCGRRTFVACNGF